MPSRWFIPVHGVDPDRVHRAHVHAAFSEWFDPTTAAHDANNKPYTVSELTRRRGQDGVTISTLTADAETRLAAAIATRLTVQLGNQTRPVARPVLLRTQSWTTLASTPPSTRWTIELLSPTTFRSGNRSSPLPCVATILGGLSRSWQRWSGLAPLTYQPRQDGAVWVSDLDLRSTMVHLQIHNHLIHLSAVRGTITLRCADAAAAKVAPLLALAPYAGIGSMRGKGMGVTRATPVGSVAARATAPTGTAHDARAPSQTR